MSTLLAQLAPQRSTQYAELAGHLAPYELALSPAGPKFRAITPLELAGQPYLKLELAEPLAPAELADLGGLATLGGIFDCVQRFGDAEGPWLRPRETGFTFALPYDLVVTRRYRGKTNELFTHFLCNVARFSSAFAGRPWRELRVCDPLAGGGTTVFMALALGAHAAGVEHSEQDVTTSAAFLRDYLRQEGIGCELREERFKGLGRRWSFQIGKRRAGLPEPQQCILALGDTAQAAALLPGFRPHLLVADLPYGVQHEGQLTRLLSSALPAWASMLLPGGVLALAWDATRFGREQMVGQVAAVPGLVVLTHPPYDALAHRVDRVIRRRDVVLAIRSFTPREAPTASGS